MIPAIKAEFRKLLSVRSTYFITILALLLAGFIAFWIFGYKHVGGAYSSTVLAECLAVIIAFLGTFVSIIVILSVGHEYRYNTIMYTLTAASSRTQVFFAKIFAVLVLSLVISTVICLASVLLLKLGFAVADISLGAQTFNGVEFLFHSSVYITGMVVFAYIITLLIRNLIGAVAFLFIVPSTVEQLLSLLLKENTKYLPYSALGKFGSSGSIDVTLGLSVVGTYVLLGGFLAWLLFLRRDAN